MIDLAGKTVLITGATGGLGRALVKQFLLEGCHIIPVGRDEDKLKQLYSDMNDYAKLASKSGTLSNPAVCDFTLDYQVSGLLNHLPSGIDILINCAGIFPMKGLLCSTVIDWEKTFAVNVKTPFRLSCKIGAQMAERGWGRIVNIGSSSCYNGSADTGLYCTSKHALLGLSRSLRLELKGSGVRVFTVSPGSIQTPMGKTDTRQDYSTFIKPDEIANYISYIIKFDSEMISDEVRLNRTILR